MRKNLHIILIATMLLSTSTVWSQSNNEMRQVYAEAESAYQLGQIEQAINILQQNYKSFQGNAKQNALRPSTSYSRIINLFKVMPSRMLCVFSHSAISHWTISRNPSVMPQCYSILILIICLPWILYDLRIWLIS